MGTVGSTGNEFVYASDASYSLQKSERRKRDFKKDMMEGWSATNASKFIDNVLWDSSS